MPMITIDNPTRAQFNAAAYGSEVSTATGLRYRKRSPGEWRRVGKNGGILANVEGKASIDLTDGHAERRAVKLFARITIADQLALGLCYRGRDMSELTDVTAGQRLSICKHLRGLGLLHPTKWAIVDPPPKPNKTQLRLMRQAAACGWDGGIQGADLRAARASEYLHVTLDVDAGRKSTRRVYRLTDAGAEWLIRYDGYDLVRDPDGSWRTPEL